MKDPPGTTALVCLVGAPLAVAAGLAAGSWRAGVAIALGLLVGAANGFLARWSLGADLGFRMSSLSRLAVLSAVGIGLGALLGLAFVPLTILGLAAAQLGLAVASIVAMARAEQRA